MPGNIIVPTNQEIAFKQCLEMLKYNPLMMSTYYTTLFATFRSLLHDDDWFRLQHMVDDIEIWLSDEFNTMTLKEAEVLMYQNMDLKSGFIVKGEMIEQLAIQSRLEDMKQWLTQKLYTYLRYIRFTSNIDVK